MVSTIYWFMLPISICIATIAMTFGIGGAAFFSPVFIVLFPLIKVPTLAASDAFGAALLTELAGFTSGLIGYGYKGLIDYRTAFILSIMSVPMAIMGTMMKSMIAKKFGSQYLILTFAVVLLILVIYIIFNPVDHKPETDIEQLKESQNEKKIGINEDLENAEDSKGDNLEHYTLNSTIEESNKERAQSSIVEFVKNRVIIDRYGNRYEYKICRPILGMILIAIGAFSVGLVSVGIGETCISVLYSKCGIPLRVSAGTSVLVVTIIVFASSLTNIIKNGYGSIPWDLVMFTVPGVIIGGQIGTCVSSKISPYWTAKLLILMFLILAGIMGYETYNKWNSN